ncbi:hypothetical protein [uncultured Shimia sp.]|uniref:hypothetical protein n=1 Tax=uncultured Shimia sp. TaxID=573152 RepID=UPI0026240DA5|nr:hypothetical protein [uncultured Shimia sp.]
MTTLSRRQMMTAVVAATAAAAIVPVAAMAQNSIPDPKAGMGQIVFYRSGSTAGSAVRFTIQDANGKTVADLKRGAVNVVDVPPGDNFFRVPEANNTEGTIKVAAGQTLYIRCYLNAATFSGKLQFEEVSKERAYKDLRIK